MTARPLAALLGLEALTLAVASSLHLAHAMPGESKPFSGTGAGTAEAVICVVLALAGLELLRRGAAARPVGLGAVAFAILGFAVGLDFSIRGGATADLAYHGTMLPILPATAIAAWRLRSRTSP